MPRLRSPRSGGLKRRNGPRAPAHGRCLALCRKAAHAGGAGHGTRPVQATCQGPALAGGPRCTHSRGASVVCCACLAVCTRPVCNAEHQELAWQRTASTTPRLQRVRFKFAWMATSRLRSVTYQVCCLSRQLRNTSLICACSPLSLTANSRARGWFLRLGWPASSSRVAVAILQTANCTAWHVVRPTNFSRDTGAPIELSSRYGRGVGVLRRGAHRSQ
eukprot:COSAG02_NODE_1_length_108762_cov_456.708287_21_plen_218_part_00